MTETYLYRGESESVSVIYFHEQCAWARLMLSAGSYAALSTAPCINMYPRVVHHCSATAGPLSRKVKYASFTPLSIFHISPI